MALASAVLLKRDCREVDRRFVKISESVDDRIFRSGVTLTPVMVLIRKRQRFVAAIARSRFL